uniref:Uncharacterized protein n=1 Tax=Plectus sambesii TaxID=2011161 RepID=A0A914VDT4_9BILA
MMLSLLTIVLIAFIPIATTLRCESGSDVLYQSYECPAEIDQCFKFVCNITNGQQAYVNRGCSLLQACQSNLDTCRTAGGQGQCYHCNNGDDCNGTSLTVASLTAILSGLLLFLLFVRI